MWHLLRAWLALARASVIRESEFRGNFIVGLLRQVLWLGVFIIVIDVLFQNTSSLGGWSYAEVLLIIGLSRMFEGVTDLLFTRNLVGEFPQEVNDGRFDFTLVRPLPTQFFAAFQKIHIANVGNALAGVVLVVFTLIELQADITISTLVFFVLALAIATIIRYAILLLLVSLAFVLERFNGMHAFDVVLTEPLTYPFSIFPDEVRVVLTYVLPLAFIVYVPAQTLTGRLDATLLAIGAGIAAALVLLANHAWRAGIRRYSSASS